ncbi:unnamed protein product [Protopolystoma xenopodis]|uniref:Uncharacterized protein n=1 Tax=Protopolystoma xenopodis TaxID=117903 RepID=A0A3S5BLK3_9PLAT|nr:unnamed protein product [Protopolystoma xenopodis]
MLVEQQRLWVTGFDGRLLDPGQNVRQMGLKHGRKHFPPPPPPQPPPLDFSLVTPPPAPSLLSFPVSAHLQAKATTFRQVTASLYPALASSIASPPHPDTTRWYDTAPLDWDPSNVWPFARETRVNLASLRMPVGIGEDAEQH